MPNVELKVEMFRFQINATQLAAKVGMHPVSVHRLLRSELPEHKRIVFHQAIKEIKRDRALAALEDLELEHA